MEQTERLKRIEKKMAQLKAQKQAIINREKREGTQSPNTPTYSKWCAC